MANTAQKAILRAKIAGVLKDLMVKTTAEQVYLDDTTTLAAKLQELINALNGKAASSHTHSQSEVTGLTKALEERVTTAMNDAISKAVNDLIDGAPSTYDTLKEIADYIAEHEDVVKALNQAIGNKADASTVTALQTTVTTIQNAVGNIKSSDITNWNSKSKVFYSASEPSNLAEGDMWVQLLN